jgi:threonylcarbamoyladenosine tRNA methylthiotransferase MtaB
VARRARDLRPGIAFGADLIAGFPTETEEAFAETLALVEEADLTMLHVFPYSERAGTPAASMPSVPRAVRRERAARLRVAGAAAAARFDATRVGRWVRVLVETETRGHCEHFRPVSLSAPAAPGAIVTAVVTGADTHGLIAA